MNVKHSAFASTSVGASAAAAFAGFGKYGSRICFAPEGGAGSGGGTSSEPVKEPEGGKPAGEPAPSEELACALRELEDAKGKLKGFDGFDAGEYRKLKADKLAADAAKVEKDRQEAEARGEFDRVKASMVEQHGAAMQGLQSQIDTLTGEKANLARQIDDLTIGASFLNSRFVADDLVLTPDKARVVYGSHFVQEGGKTVAYDKPASAAGRTKLVDAKGEPLGFEDALKKIVAADSDKDRMLRSKMLDGAGSNTVKNKAVSAVQDTGLKGAARIAAALAARNAAKTA